MLMRRICGPWSVADLSVHIETLECVAAVAALLLGAHANRPADDLRLKVRIAGVAARGLECRCRLRRPERRFERPI